MLRTRRPAFAHHGKSLNQKLVQHFGQQLRAVLSNLLGAVEIGARFIGDGAYALLDALAEFLGFRTQLFVRELLHLGFEGTDGLNSGSGALEFAVVLGAEDLGDYVFTEQMESPCRGIVRPSWIKPSILDAGGGDGARRRSSLGDFAAESVCQRFHVRFAAKMATFYDQFCKCTAQWPANVALEIQRHERVESYTYAQVQRSAESIGNWLAANGLKPGDRIAILADNHPRWVMAYQGSLRLAVRPCHSTLRCTRTKSPNFCRIAGLRLCFAGAGISPRQAKLAVGWR